MPHRCAFGCKDTGNVMHSFPNPNKFPERFKAWANLLGYSLEILTDYDIYKKKRICDIHFTDEHRNRFKRLNALAMPTLYLPDKSHDITTTSGQSEAYLTFSQPTTSISFPSTSDKSHCSAATDSVTMEHNYSVISRLKQKRLLKDASVRKGVQFNCIQMRPLQKKMKYLQNEIGRLRKKGKSFKARLANAEKLSNKVAFQLVTKNMTKAAQLFVHMQLQSKKKSKGRRFSIEEKVMSLSLFKKSPKCYRLLNKYFALPSAKAMKRLLSQIKLVPGINPIIFEKIKKVLAEKDVPDRLCSLMFDEMSITPQILYNAHKDELEGFASNQEASFADHALVFMVKGVKNNFKQPIAYYFTTGLKKHELEILIKSVVQHALENSLIVVNTVCDQSPVNVGAITELVNKTKAAYLRQGKEWRHEMFRVNGQSIIPLYDTPHLIKGLRNNLLTKDMTYVTSNQKKTIKWEYYQMVYAADKCYGELRLLDKITEEHVNPDKINKMRVKSATQIFSHSVAVVTEHLTARKDLPEECRQIIDITLLIDNLFDSLNVSSMFIPNGKIYKGPVKHNSPHHQLWRKPKEVLKL